MAGRISELDLLATPDAVDMIEVLDVSDLSETSTGKNKRSPVSAFGGSAFYGAARVPFSEGVGNYPTTGHPGGIPGRQLSIGQSAVTPPAGYPVGLPFIVSPGETATFNRWVCLVDTPQAGAKFNAAVYSVSTFLDGATGTKVAGTEIANIDFSSGGQKQMSLAGPVTLPPGRYWAVYLGHGSSPAASMFGFNGDPGFLGTNMDHSSNALLAHGLALDAGKTSLAATYNFTCMAVGTQQGWFYATMRNA